MTASISLLVLLVFTSVVYGDQNKKPYGYIYIDCNKTNDTILPPIWCNNQTGMCGRDMTKICTTKQPLCDKPTLLWAALVLYQDGDSTWPVYQSFGTDVVRNSVYMSDACMTTTMYPEGGNTSLQDSPACLRQRAQEYLARAKAREEELARERTSKINKETANAIIRACIKEQEKTP